jgi:2-iminobutanoate/2-iminopropanoate deaminase
MAVETERIHTRPSTMPPGPFAQAYRAGDLVFVAGQVAYDADKGGPVSDDIKEQTTKAVDNLRAVLRAAGADLADVVKLTCILPSLPEHYAAFNEAFAAAFDGVHPARTTIQAGLLGGYLVEIEAVAVLPSSS